MHPIEHLRYVARSGSVGGRALVSETAYALASLGAERADLLISCRRILARHPYAGALWAACARLVLSAEPAGLAWELVDRSPVDVDAVGGHLPSDAVLVGPVDWGADAVVTAAIARATLEFDGPADPIDLDVDLDDLEVPDDPLLPTMRPTVTIVEDRDGAADRLRRSMRRLDVDAVVVPLARLDGAAIVFEPTLVAIDTMIVSDTVASTIAEAAAAGFPVWALVADDEILPAPYGAEASARVDDRQWTSIDRSVLAGVIGDSGRRPVADLVASVPFAPELLRPPV